MNKREKKAAAAVADFPVCRNIQILPAYVVVVFDGEKELAILEEMIRFSGCAFSYHLAIRGANAFHVHIAIDALPRLKDAAARYGAFLDPSEKEKKYFCTTVQEQADTAYLEKIESDNQRARTSKNDQEGVSSSGAAYQVSAFTPADTGIFQFA